MKKNNVLQGMKHIWAEQLKKWEPELSRTEHQLVDYINRTPEKASALTLSELSEACGVSKPVIINCFRKLEFEDYKSFQSAIEQFFASRIDSLRASREMKSRVRTVEELISEAVAVDVSALQRLQGSLDPSDLKRIAEMLNEAGMVYLIGEGTGHYPAHFLWHRMRRYGLNALLIDQDQRHIPDILHPAGAGDMLIMFHYSDRDDWLWPVLDLASRKGIRSLLISGTIYPDYVSRSDMFLHIPRGDIHFKNSMAVPMHFANQLLLSYELIFEEKIESMLTSLEESRRDWDAL